MSIAGFLVLLAIAVLVWLTGTKVAPVLMPGGTLRTIALGWAGGFMASWLDSTLWQVGPSLAEINPVAAGIGCGVLILCLGIAPFIKILLGRR